MDEYYRASACWLPGGSRAVGEVPVVVGNFEVAIGWEVGFVDK